MNPAVDDSEIPIVIVDDDLLEELLRDRAPEEPPERPQPPPEPPPPPSIWKVPPRPTHSSCPPGSVPAARPATRRRIRRNWIFYLASRLAAALLVTAALGGGFLVVQKRLLVTLYPIPGQLAAPHAHLTETSRLDCSGCHDLYGLVEGCLGCHEEIAGQFHEGRGFHPFLIGNVPADCGRCHAEHQGFNSPLINQWSWGKRFATSFDHPHVAFTLEGRHGTLACEECHRDKLQEPFRLPAFSDMARQHTFLGLKQNCRFCHEDPHAGGLIEDCLSCHEQEAFRPAPHFQHPDRLPLEGGHARVACDRCHPIPEAVPETRPEWFPFNLTRGTKCADCHSSPHTTEFAVDCEHCHRGKAPTSGREGMTVELHARTGFQLLAPHDEVDCERCHDPELPYAARHAPLQIAEGRKAEDECQSCHEDIHEGQFVAQGKRCLDCHERAHFKPHRFDLEQHAAVFALEGAHVRAECESCHQEKPESPARIFVGTSRECRDCHEEPHAGQFADRWDSCSGCHDTERFIPARLGLDEHQAAFPLLGSHRAVPCTSCHLKEEETAVRRFIGTTRQCRDCHADPHGGQFEPELASGDCDTCHRKDSETFAIRPFDHLQRTGFPLLGAHAEAECSDCHRGQNPAASAADAALLFRGTSPECSSCHRDVHHGQFRRGGATPCGECHASPTAWTDLRFDHNRQARFPLEGSHARVPCAKCHHPVRLEDGAEITLYKPLRTECNACHEVASR